MSLNHSRVSLEIASSKSMATNAKTKTNGKASRISGILKTFGNESRVISAKDTA